MELALGIFATYDLTTKPAASDTAARPRRVMPGGWYASRAPEAPPCGDEARACLLLGVELSRGGRDIRRDAVMNYRDGILERFARFLVLQYELRPVFVCFEHGAPSVVPI